MDNGYLTALEKQIDWMQWSYSEGESIWKELSFADTLPIYKEILKTADTYYMDSHFCDLVDLARKDVPETLEFDKTWMQSPCGFLWLERPFRVPTLKKHVAPFKIDHIELNAIGWRKLPSGEIVQNGDGSLSVTEDDEYQLVCFQAFNQYVEGRRGFGCWSFFRLCPGQRLVDRINKFESIAHGHALGFHGAEYVDEVNANNDHEIRWIYTALQLMSQRLSVTVRSPVARATRRRMQKMKVEAPDVVRVITLRKKHEHKDAEAHKTVDWQWQWGVGGHWRHQPYKDGIRDIFIEAYIKGPEDKPFKPGGLKLFAARR